MRFGVDVVVRSSPVRTILHVDHRDAQLVVGDRVYIGQGVNISAAARIEIGDDVRIADHVIIMDTDYHNALDRGAAAEAAPISIGAGSTIGAHTLVLRGTRLGRNVEVAPGSVVFGRIADGSKVAGARGRVLTAS